MSVDILCQCGRSTSVDEADTSAQRRCASCGKTLSFTPDRTVTSQVNHLLADAYEEEATYDSMIAPSAATESAQGDNNKEESFELQTTVFTRNGDASSSEKDSDGFELIGPNNNLLDSNSFAIGETRIGDPSEEHSDKGDFEVNDNAINLCTHAEKLLNADPFYRITRAKRSKQQDKVDPSKGFVYGIHRIVRSHVKGGMGMVHIAYDQFLKREVALKELFKESLTDESIVHRFIVEAEITAQLEHPGIVPIHSLGLDLNGNPYYTMKLIRGRTLQEAIKHYFKNPSEAELKTLVRKFVSVCQTMSFVHNKGVIHRDLKPANIMLSEHGETLVMDWGIAKAYNKDLATGTGITLSETNLQETSSTGGGYSRPELTLAGTVVGTPAFMSPEQASPDSQEVGPISDIFSLGAILFYMLTGRNAYTGKTSQEVLTKVLTTNPPRPSDVARNIPPGLEAICLKAMCRNTKGRYQTANELVADLCNWLDGEPITAMEEKFTERTWRYFRKNRHMSMSVFLVSFIFFIIIALTTILLDRNQQRTRFIQTESKVVVKKSEETTKRITALETELKTVQSECAKLRQDRDSTNTDELRIGFENQLNEMVGREAVLKSQIAELVRLRKELGELNKAIQREKQ